MSCQNYSLRFLIQRFPKLKSSFLRQSSRQALEKSGVSRGPSFLGRVFGHHHSGVRFGFDKLMAWDRSWGQGQLETVWLNTKILVTQPIYIYMRESMAIVLL